MDIKLKKMTLKGHNTFYLRDGWLNKVILQEGTDFLRNQQEACDRLGVGSGMVKAIKYYLNAMGLVNLSNKNKPNSDLFDKIVAHDRYLEDDFTKFILHYKLISNGEKATIWHMFFNYVNFDEMTKEEAFESVKDLMKETFPDSVYSHKSVNDDIDCLVNLYTKKDEKDLTPEDKLQSPLSSLGLMEFDGKTIMKSTPPLEIVDPKLVLFIILSELQELSDDEETYNIAIDELINNPNNIGKVLNLTRADIYYFMDALSKMEDIEFHKTAGLDQLYINKKYSSESVFLDYFEVQ